MNREGKSLGHGPGDSLVGDLGPALGRELGIERKLARILLDLGNRPLVVIGPPGSGKTTIVTALGLMRLRLVGSSMIYVTHKLSDAIGAVTSIPTPWNCVRDNLFLILDSYEELSARPGITLLVSMAYRFKAYNNYVRYLRYLARNPRNTHALWLLGRMSLLRGIVTDENNVSERDEVATVIVSRDVRGVYMVMTLILNSMCRQDVNDLLILDDVSILPMREEALLRVTRIVRGVTNVWIVMHSIGGLSIEELNIPTIITSHSGPAKSLSRLRDILNQVRPGEALYMGVNDQLKVKIRDVVELRKRLLNEKQ